MHFLYELRKSLLGYDRSTDYSESLGLVDFAFALVNSAPKKMFGEFKLHIYFKSN